MSTVDIRGVPIEIRDGTMDADIVSEVEREYGWMRFPGATVLDVGACFGAFSVMAAASGAHRVIAVEPDPDNHDLLVRNFIGNGSLPPEWSRMAIRGAIGHSGGVTSFYRPPGRNRGNGTTVESARRRNRERIDVRTMGFYDVLESWRPQLVKIDCEGAEHEFLVEYVPKFVRQVAIEVHLKRKAWRQNLYRILSLFPADQWETTRTPSDTGNNWATVAGWRRK